MAQSAPARTKINTKVTIADELNDRPRKRFGYHTPREQLAKQARPVGNAHRGRPGSACR